MFAYRGIDFTKPFPSDVVHIWVVGLKTPDRILEDYYSYLPKDERSRAKRFKFEKDRKNFVVCRGVLRVLSGLYLDQRPKDIAFGYSEFGKPYFIDASLKFNLSHSGDLAVIGFLQKQELGIDIERIKNDFDVLDIARNFFSETEIKALHETTELQRFLSFYRCWTRKEAFIKAEGSGLSFPLDSFAVSMDSDTDATLLETAWNDTEKEKWLLHPFIPEPGYRSALAVRGKVKSILLNKWQHR